jgi:lipopolysaccharide export LptBFGC system permease protein LptF
MNNDGELNLVTNKILNDVKKKRETGETDAQTESFVEENLNDEEVNAILDAADLKLSDQILAIKALQNKEELKAYEEAG